MLQIYCLQNQVTLKVGTAECFVYANKEKYSFVQLLALHHLQSINRMGADLAE